MLNIRITKTIPKTDVPALYNLSESQLAQALGSSFYTSSFVTGSDDHQYLILSHVLLSAIPGNSSSSTALTRFSILDITEPDNGYWAFTTTTIASAESVTNKPLTLAFEHVSFYGLSSDSVSTMRTTGEAPGLSYDITWDSSSLVIYDGGTGTYSFGTAPANQWSMPAGRTRGNIALNGTTINIDPSNSLTWYDRQWQDGGPVLGNWTWFELHFQDPSVRASISAIDENTEPMNVTRFANIRTPVGTHVLPFTMNPDYTSSWYSECSNITYPLAWTLEFLSGESLLVKSIKPDQEICGQGGVAYEGFIEVTGSVLGYTASFGLVELVDFRASPS